MGHAGKASSVHMPGSESTFHNSCLKKVHSAPCFLHGINLSPLPLRKRLPAGLERVLLIFGPPETIPSCSHGRYWTQGFVNQSSAVPHSGQSR